MGPRSAIAYNIMVKRMGRGMQGCPSLGRRRVRGPVRLDVVVHVLPHASGGGVLLAGAQDAFTVVLRQVTVGGEGGLGARATTAGPLLTQTCKMAGRCCCMPARRAGQS